jgi:choline dehydrogenase-like flavoprotein
VSASPTDPDFLIVGAGAAGGVVAKELATAGFHVVVLEQGPWLREPDFKHDEIWANRRHALTNDHARQPNTRRLTESETATLQPTVSYGRGVGGGSVHFTANYWRFRELDFVERSRRGGLAGTGGVVGPGNPRTRRDGRHTQGHLRRGLLLRRGGGARSPSRSRRPRRSTGPKSIISATWRSTDWRTATFPDPEPAVETAVEADCRSDS